MRHHIYYLSIFLLLFVACEHKELCYHHPHEVTVKVEFDWIDAPDATPQGMCVYFYSLNGGGYYRFDFNNRYGGEVKLRVGAYKVLCFNNDTESVNFFNVDDFNTHGVNTREGNVLEPIYGNSANYAPRASGVEAENVVISPDMMWGCIALDVEITDDGTSYICIPYGDKGRLADDPVTNDEHIITLFPHKLVCTYTYEIRNVKNLKHMEQMSGTISGMSGAMTFSTEELDMECVTIPFESHRQNDSTIVGQFYTFGHHAENNAPHKMVFYVIMDNGEKLCYMDLDNLDVTQQVHKAPDFRHVHLIIDGLELPLPIENGEGFKTYVDDWVVREEEIVL